MTQDSLLIRRGRELAQAVRAGEVTLNLGAGSQESSLTQAR